MVVLYTKNGLNEGVGRTHKLNHNSSNVQAGKMNCYWLTKNYDAPLQKKKKKITINKSSDREMATDSRVKFFLKPSESQSRVRTQGSGVTKLVILIFLPIVASFLARCPGGYLFVVSHT